jgi:IS5 family transposase
LEALIEPHAPKSKTGRPPFALQTMLRIHFMQQWFTLSDPAMEEALHDVPLFREFSSSPGTSAFPTRARSCASGTCWSAASWPSRCWPW